MVNLKEEQLLLFYEPTEDKLLREVEMLKKELSNVRRGLFAKVGELTKENCETKKELEYIKLGIMKYG